MKIEEAIKQLNMHKSTNVWSDSIAEAIDMAIEALRNEINCVKCEHYTERETATGIKGVCKMDTAHRGDIIYRQDAIDALAKEMPSLTTPDGSGEFDHDIQITDEAFVDCMQIINELPSAEPKTGEWIDWLGKGNEWECSVCKCSIESHGSIAYKYCPNCGADMRGEKHEEQ